MGHIKNKFIVLLSVFLSLGISSCKKWVGDVDQPLGVDDSEVFSKEQGFREALNGIYLQMGSEQLYGKELTMGVLSLAGRNYDSISYAKAGAGYYNAAILNLTDPSVKRLSANVWNGMYQGIANINNVLENIDTRKGIFTGNNYNTFKGESLALRAYLHFDLLRLFSSIDPSSIGIPYRASMDFNTSPISTVEQTLDYCIADLKQAESLLDANDLENSHLTKWAVKGLLARIYLYRGDKVNAEKFASEIIKDSPYTLSKSNTDLLFTRESLFKLYISNHKFYSFFKTFFGQPNLIGLSVASQNALFGLSSPDYRRNFIDMNTGNASGTPLVPVKFNGTSANIFPLLRLTEMYYILAECASDKQVAIDYINKVREARNLPAISYASVTNETALVSEIMNEYRKEFLGEGQLFFYLKRNNTAFDKVPFSPIATGSKVPVSENATYIFVRTEK